MFQHEVRSFYNPTSGWWIADASRAGYTLFRQPASDDLVRGLANHLTEALDSVGPHGRVLHLAHSGGALLTYLAAKHHLQPDQTSRIDVVTFGGARSITRKYFSGRTINYYARNDPLIHLDRRAGALVKEAGNTTYQEVIYAKHNTTFVFLEGRAHNPLLDHSLEGPTYQHALQWEADAFRRRYYPTSEPYWEKSSAWVRDVRKAVARATGRHHFFNVTAPSPPTTRSLRKRVANYTGYHGFFSGKAQAAPQFNATPLPEPFVKAGWLTWLKRTPHGLVATNGTVAVAAPIPDKALEENVTTGGGAPHFWQRAWRNSAQNVTRPAEEARNIVVLEDSESESTDEEEVQGLQAWFGQHLWPGARKERQNAPAKGAPPNTTVLTPPPPPSAGAAPLDQGLANPVDADLAGNGSSGGHHFGFPSWVHVPWHREEAEPPLQEESPEDEPPRDRPPGGQSAGVQSSGGRPEGGEEEVLEAARALVVAHGDGAPRSLLRKAWGAVPLRRGARAGPPGRQEPSTPGIGDNRAVGDGAPASEGAPTAEGGDTGRVGHGAGVAEVPPTPNSGGVGEGALVPYRARPGAGERSKKGGQSLFARVLRRAPSASVVEQPATSNALVPSNSSSSSSNDSNGSNNSSSNSGSSSSSSSNSSNISSSSHSSINASSSLLVSPAPPILSAYKNSSLGNSSTLAPEHPAPPAPGREGSDNTSPERSRAQAVDRMQKQLSAPEPTLVTQLLQKAHLVRSAETPPPPPGRGSRRINPHNGDTGAAGSQKQMQSYAPADIPVAERAVSDHSANYSTPQNGRGEASAGTPAEPTEPTPGMTPGRIPWTGGGSTGHQSSACRELVPFQDTALCFAQKLAGAVPQDPAAASDWSGPQPVAPPATTSTLPPAGHLGLPAIRTPGALGQPWAGSGLGGVSASGSARAGRWGRGWFGRVGRRQQTTAPSASFPDGRPPEE